MITPLNSLFLSLLLFGGFVSANIGSICSETIPLPEAEVSGCTKQPCKFVLNANNTLTVKFKSPKYLDKFRPDVVAEALGAVVPYPLGQDDGCVGVTNTPCPIAKGEYVEYSYSMFLPPIFPKISLKLQFSLVDSHDESKVVCFKVAGQVV